MCDRLEAIQTDIIAFLKEIFVAGGEILYVDAMVIDNRSTSYF